MATAPPATIPMAVPAAAPAAAPSTASKVASTAYSGMATFGRIRTTIGAMVACVLALIMVAVGAAKLRDPHTAKAAGTVTKVSSANTVVAQDGTRTYQAVVTASYTTAAGTSETAAGLQMASTQPIATGAALTLYYDPANPGSAKAEANPKLAGWGFIAGGLVVAALGVGVAYMARKSKVFAALDGAAGIAGLARDL